MKGEWPQTELGPICSKIGSGATPRGGDKVYPPDMQARATELVLEQAEVLCKDWSADSE